jgi:hypothetical protein
VTKYLYGPSLDLLGMVKLDDFDRWDFELPLYFSADANSHIGVYFIPRVLFSRTTFKTTITEQPCGCPGGTNTPRVSVAQGRVDMMFYGATLGLRFGGWRVAALVELTVGNTEANPVIFGKRRALGGATVYPAGGLAITF